jgi:hypothetical protein
MSDFVSLFDTCARERGFRELGPPTSGSGSGIVSKRFETPSGVFVDYCLHNDDTVLYQLLNSAAAPKTYDSKYKWSEQEQGWLRFTDRTYLTTRELVDYLLDSATN